MAVFSVTWPSCWHTPPPPHTHTRTVSVKSKLPCVTMWKAYAPVVMFDNDLSEKRLVAIKKISETSSSGRVVHIHNGHWRHFVKLNCSFVCSSNLCHPPPPFTDVHGVSHSNCLKSELQMLSHIPPHYHLLNLLGVCLNNSTLVVIATAYVQIA